MKTFKLASIERGGAQMPVSYKGPIPPRPPDSEEGEQKPPYPDALPWGCVTILGIIGAIAIFWIATGPH